MKENFLAAHRTTTRRQHIKEACTALSNSNDFHPLEEQPQSYWQRILSFSRNAKLFLVSHAFTQITLGVFSTIMNVYLLKVGFDKTYIGYYMAAGTLAAAISSIPIGVLADRFGRRRSVLAAILLTTLSACGEVATLNPILLIVFSFTKGIGSTFKAVVQNPFLMENSTPRERIHLFSVNQALQTVASVGGSVLAGLLPMLFAFIAQAAGWIDVLEASQLRFALGFSVIFVALSSIPMYMVKEKPMEKREQHSVRSDLLAVVQDPNIRSLSIYRFMIGMGAGLTLPFFNVYLAESLNATNEEISLVTTGSRIVLTIGTLMSPYLVRYLGRIKSIVATQMLSIPTLLAIAWPGASLTAVTVIYWVRTALMNMSSPISTTLGMEIVPADKRATSSSTMNMADSLARSAAQVMGGWMMDNWGNNIPYFFTCGIYLIATIFYYQSFKKYDDPESTAHVG